MVQSVSGQHKLGVTLFTGRSQIDLIETSLEDLDRIVEVRLDRETLGEIRLWKFYQLGLMIDWDMVVLWSGQRFYWVDIQNKTLHACDQDDQVEAVYAAGSAWLLVREISVAVFDPRTSAIVDVVPLSDVNWGWKWEGDKLIVNDFQKRQFEISVDGW